MCRVTIFYLKITYNTSEANYYNFPRVSQHPNLENDRARSGVLLLAVVGGRILTIIGPIFSNPNKILPHTPQHPPAPPVTPDMKQGSSAGDPAVLALSYSYCIRASTEPSLDRCACLISSGYHLYLFYQSETTRARKSGKYLGCYVCTVGNSFTFFFFLYYNDLQTFCSGKFLVATSLLLFAGRE